MPAPSKLPGADTTIFAVMSKLAAECGAVNLSQGFPDFEPDAALLELVSHYLHAGKNQYPPFTGVRELREAVAAKLSRGGVAADAETEVTITSGATEALFCAIHSVVRAGDEVILFDPAFDSYAPAVALAGGVCVRLPLVLPEYRIDFDALAAAVNAKTRLLIINTPHNPSASVLHADDLDAIANILDAHDCNVLSDEVYEHIIFDGAQHASVLAHEKLRARSFAVFSFGKTYHATGWKVGYCVAPPALTSELRKVHQFNTFTTVTPMQYALADFLREHARYENLPAFYQQKRDAFANFMAGSRFKLLPSRGTYFQLADYSAISDMDDMAFAKWLTVEKGVAAIPLSPFYAAPPRARIVRFCFAKRDATLQRAAEMLRAV